MLFLSHLLVAGCDIGVRFSVRPSVRLSTFMSTFDIYVKVSILINYKTKQPSNLAWNISLTSWLCNIPVSKKYRTHMGPKWVFIWVLYGQPIRDSWGICNRVPCWTHMGKVIWELYGSSMGKINTHLSSEKRLLHIFIQMIINPQSQRIWWTGKVPTDRDLFTCARYCISVQSYRRPF